MNNLEKLKYLFNEKPAQILMSLYNTNEKLFSSKIAKIIDCTYSHVVKLTLFMEKLDLVSFERQGRVKYIKLTEKGDRVAKYFNKIQKEILEK